jgi:hypothetical protein
MPDAMPIIVERVELASATGHIPQIVHALPGREHRVAAQPDRYRPELGLPDMSGGLRKSWAPNNVTSDSRGNAVRPRPANRCSFFASFLLKRFPAKGDMPRWRRALRVSLSSIHPAYDVNIVRCLFTVFIVRCLDNMSA